MNLSIYIISFLISLSSFSKNYDSVDKKVTNYPAFSDVKTLSIRISNDFKDDDEKIRAVFMWLVKNTKYETDEKSWLKPNLTLYFSNYQKKRETKKEEKRIINKAMETKKANCYGYSLIVKEVCDLLKIESVIISGYAKGSLFDIGKNNLIKNHAWNAVKINNEWKLLDISWAVGYLVTEQETANDYYYFKSPNEFVNQHLPANPKWQLTPNKVSKKDFISTPILYPKYYYSEFKLTNEKKGVIKVSKKDKYITISFDKIPKDININYSFLNNHYFRSLKLKKLDFNTYQAKIKFDNNQDSYLVLFSDLLPLIGYKIEVSN